MSWGNDKITGRAVDFASTQNGLKMAYLRYETVRTARSIATQHVNMSCERGTHRFYMCCGHAGFVSHRFSADVETKLKCHVCGK